METNCFPQLRQNCWFHLLRAPPALQAAVLKMAILIVLFPPFTPSQKLPISVCNQTALRPRALTAPPCTWPSISVPGPLGTSCSSSSRASHWSPLGPLKVSSTWEGSTWFCCCSSQLCTHSRSLLPGGASPSPSHLGRIRALLKTHLPSPPVKKQSSLMALINFSLNA